jgi:YesN/AraC family two-component response regulator
MPRKSGVEALSKIVEKNYSLIVADRKLPHVDGVELIQRIEGLNSMIRRLIFTSYPTFFNVQDNTDISVNAYLTKPMEPEKLREIVRSQLAESKMVRKD